MYLTWISSIGCQMAGLISRMEGEVFLHLPLSILSSSVRVLSKGDYSSLDIFGGSLVKFDELVAKSLSRSQ